MSITAETCKEHAKDPAVLCCRAEAGITIGPENLEDPTIFDERILQYYAVEQKQVLQLAQKT